MSGLGDFVVKAPLQNYKNNIAKPITMGAKKEENQKRQKAKNGQQEGIVAKVMNSAGCMNSVSRMQFRSAPFFFTFLLFFPSRS